MSTKRRGTQQRQRVNQRARAARAQERQVRRRRLMMAVAAGVALVAVALLAAVLAGRGGSKDTTVSASKSASKSSTSTSEAPSTTAKDGKVASVADKPCVPMYGSPPTGAPKVDVEVGPPPTKLVSRDIKVGTGATVQPKDTVTVNYIGVSCSSGRIFDASYINGKPGTFSLSSVIPGWQKGIPGMKVGGQRLLGIPPGEAYGDAGSPPHIAPGETLWFVVEVLDTKAG